MSWLAWVGVLIAVLVLGIVLLGIVGGPVCYFLDRVARFVHPPRPHGPGRYSTPTEKEKQEILEALTLEEMEEIMRELGVEPPRKKNRS